MELLDSLILLETLAKTTNPLGMLELVFQVKCICQVYCFLSLKATCNCLCPKHKHVCWL